MTDPYSWARQGGGQVDSLAPAASLAATADRNVRDILAEDEEPSSFESFFRFIGRPGFMVRTLLSGDLKGFAKNTAQFAQELAVPIGAFNHSLLPFGELTSAKDRPEGSDLLHRWGVIKDKSALGPWEKFGVDFAVGLVTDPLSLVGGGGAKAGTTGVKLAGAGRAAARQELVGALRRGAEGTGKALHERFLQAVQEGVTDVVSRTSKAPGFESLGQASSLDDLYKLVERLPHTGSGLTSTTAAKIAREVEGKAAEKVFFDTLRQAEREGVALRSGVQGRVPVVPDEVNLGKWFSADPAALLPELDQLLYQRGRAAVLPQIGQVLPDGKVAVDLTKSLADLGDSGKFANSMRSTKNLKSISMTLGQPMEVLFRPENERVVQAVVNRINEAVKNVAPGAVPVNGMGPVQAGASSFRTVRNGLRDLGMSDEFINPLLRRQFPNWAEPAAGTLDDYVKLGQDLPLSIANEGVEALIKAGMAPGGGLSFTPLWSDKIGKAIERTTGWHYRNGFNYVPWGDVASATGPGLISNLGKRMGYSGLSDSLLERAWTTAQRKILDRFRFGKVDGVSPKAASLVENAARASDASWRGGSMKVLRGGLENFSDVVPQDAYTQLADEVFKAEDVFHAARRAWEAEGPEHLDEIAKKITDSVSGPMLARGRVVPANAIDEVVKLVRSQSPEIRDAPWNVKLTHDSLRNLVAQAATSTMKTVKEAGAAAAKLLERAEAVNGPLIRAQKAAQVAYRMMDRAFEESKNVANLAPGTRQTLAALQVNQNLRKEVAAALNDLRRLEGTAPASKVRFQKVVKELNRRQDELASVSRELRGKLRQNAGVAWPKMIEDVDKAIRASELDMKASTRVWNKLQSDMRAAFTTRNGELGKAVQASARQLLAGRLTQGIVDTVMQGRDPALRKHIEKALEYGQGEMRKIPPFMRYHAKNVDELRQGFANRPAWEHIDHANPFYLSHQVSPKLVEAMTDPRLPESVRTNLMSQFDMARQFPTAKEFLAHMAQVADDLGLEGVSDELVQRDYRALIIQRGLAFERTKALQKLYQDVAGIAGREGGAWKVYEEYLDGVLRPTGPRKNTFLKFLSGGTLDIPLGKAILTKEGAMKGVGVTDFLNRSMDMEDFAKIVQKEGNAYMRVKWPGLNAMFKPFLTSIPTNVRFRFRNMLAAPIQAMFHPEIGFSGVEPILKTFRHDGMVRWAISHFSKAEAGEFSAGWAKGHRLKQTSETLAAMTPQQRQAWAVSTVVRATMAPSAAERMAARGALGHLHDRVGPYAWPEALDVIDNVLARRLNTGDVDIREGIDNMAELFSQINLPMHSDPNRLGKVVRGLRKFVDFGQRISEEQEAQVRMLTALNLMKLGKSPVEVVSEVNRLQIDYSIQSTVEQWARSVIPFARYMIGATAWAGDMLSNPSGAGKGVVGKAVSPQGLGLAQRSLSGTGEGESSILPRHAKETIALPLPWKDLEGNREFLTSLGFPQEVVINMLSLTGGRRESFMHTVAGGVNPVLKLPAEYATNRNFFFGTEWGEYRRAPFMLQPFAREVPGPNGTVRHEVPGPVNELINASPLSGVESTINRLADSRQPIHLRLLNAMTGFRVQGVDEEAELQKRIAQYLKDHVRSGEVGELEVFFSRLREEDVPEEVKTILSALEQRRAEKRRSAK